MYSFTRNCPAPRLKKWSYMDSTWCVSTWCQPALGAWNQSCFLLSSFLAKSIIRAITGSQKAVCEASVRSQPDVLKKEHVSFVRRNELRCPGTAPCEADMQMVPWVLPRGASFSWGDQTEMSDTDWTALLCFSSKMHKWHSVYWSKTERADQVGWGIRKVHGQIRAGAWKNRFLERQRKEEKGVCPNWKTATKSQGLENVARMSRPDGCLTRGALRPREDAGKDRQDSISLQSCKHPGSRAGFSESRDRSFRSLWSLHTQDNGQEIKVAPREKKKIQKGGEVDGETRKMEKDCS